MNTPPEVAWVLIDLDNGDDATRRYLWWFKTRALARAHIKHQRKNKFAARLSGPYRYQLMRDGQL